MRRAHMRTVRVLRHHLAVVAQGLHVVLQDYVGLADLELGIGRVTRIGLGRSSRLFSVAIFSLNWRCRPWHTPFWYWA